MKILFDLLPAILFFTAFKMYDLFIATAVLMIVIPLQIFILWILHKKIEPMYKVMFWAVLIFGTLTFVFRNEMFIKWKVSVVNWVLAVIFFGSQYIGKNPLVKRMLGQAFIMPDKLWKKVNLTWVFFFIFCGGLNLLVAFTCSNDTWMDFKFFGLTGLTFIFMFGLVLTLRKYIPKEEKEK